MAAGEPLAAKLQGGKVGICLTADERGYRGASGVQKQRGQRAETGKNKLCEELVDSDCLLCLLGQYQRTT